MAAYTVPTIAITGSPKDYTGLVAARRRQKEADEAKAEEARRKKDEEIYKATTVKNTEYLPMRIPQVLQKKAEIVNRMLEASQSGDFSANDAAKTEWEAYLQNLKGEKLQADEAIRGTEKGSHLSTGNLRALYTAQGTDSKEIQDLVKSGDVVIEEGTGRIVPNLIPNTDFTQVWKGLSSNYKNKHTGELKTAEDGTQFFVKDYDIEGLKKGLMSTYLGDPNIRKKAELTYRQNNDVTGLSKEAIAEKARQDFIENGLEFGTGGQWVRKPQKAELNFYAGGAGDKDPEATQFEGAPKTTKIIVRDPTSNTVRTYESINHAGYSVGDVTITSPVPGGAIFVDSGEPVTDAQLKTAKFNNFFVKVLLKKDWKDPVTGHIYPKGSAIPKEYENVVIDNGLGRASVVAQGLANGQSLQYDAAGLNSSAFSTQTEKEKPAIVQQVNRAKKQAQDLQNDIDRQYEEAKKVGRNQMPVSKESSIKPPKEKTEFESRFEKPNLNIKNSDGSFSTHKMASAEVDGKYIAYPTIVNKGGKLVELGQKEAIDYALKNGEYKEFKSDAEARSYAEGGYKKGTKLEGSKRNTPIVPNANRQAEIDEEKRKKAAKIAKDAGIAPIPR